MTPNIKQMAYPNERTSIHDNTQTNDFSSYFSQYKQESHKPPQPSIYFPQTTITTP